MIKRSIVLIPATVAFLAFAATAQAHNGVPTGTCDGASATYTQFAGGSNTVRLDVVSDPLDFRQETTGVIGRSGNLSIPRTFYGQRTLTVRAYWLAGDTSDGHAGDITRTFELNCPEPPPPPVVPPVVSIPTPVPPGVATRSSCAVLRANGAGRRWMVRYRCIHPKPRLNCAELRRRGAGRKSLLARGCVIPPRPGIVIVTG